MYWSKCRHPNRPLRRSGPPEMSAERRSIRARDRDRSSPVCYRNIEFGHCERAGKNGETGETLLSCSTIITEPNAYVAEVHDRMPVLLMQEQFEPWLNGEAGYEYLKPAPNDLLQKWPVSQRMNSSKAPTDDPSLIEKIAA
jgi:hypothetical protein